MQQDPVKKWHRYSTFQIDLAHANTVANLNRSSAGLSIQIKLEAAGSEREQTTVLGLYLRIKLFIMF